MTRPHVTHFEDRGAKALRALAEDWYGAHTCKGRPSCALSLLLLWDRPWSGTALRWAGHAIASALARGIDVLE